MTEQEKTIQELVDFLIEEDLIANSDEMEVRDAITQFWPATSRRDAEAEADNYAAWTGRLMDEKRELREQLEAVTKERDELAKLANEYIDELQVTKADRDRQIALRDLNIEELEKEAERLGQEVKALRLQNDIVSGDRKELMDKLAEANDYANACRKEVNELQQKIDEMQEVSDRGIPLCVVLWREWKDGNISTGITNIYAYMDHLNTFVGHVNATFVTHNVPVSLHVYSLAQWTRLSEQTQLQGKHNEQSG